MLGTYVDFDSMKLEKSWVTLQSCMDCILINNGDNDYKIPHMNKDKLIRDGTLPRRLSATNKAISTAETIEDLEHELDIDRVIQSLEADGVAAYVQALEEGHGGLQLQHDQQVVDQLLQAVDLAF